jgi:predicted phosphoribosyltransferase
MVQVTMQMQTPRLSEELDEITAAVECILSALRVGGIETARAMAINLKQTVDAKARVARARGN